MSSDSAAIPHAPSLDQLRREDFEALLGTPFAIVLRDGELPLELIEARTLKSPSPRPTSPFALLFRGPQRPVLPQGTYPLAHGTLGRLELFMVPIGPDAVGMRYEIIFN